MKNLLILFLAVACTDPLELESTSLFEHELTEIPRLEHPDSEILWCIGAETMPKFPGGTEALVSFIKENINYPTPGKCIEGKVFVMFVVEADGTIGDLNVVKGLGDAYDKAALEVFEKMPLWNSAALNGHPTRVRMVFPVTFRH